MVTPKGLGLHGASSSANAGRKLTDKQKSLKKSDIYICTKLRKKPLFGLWGSIKMRENKCKIFNVCVSSPEITVCELKNQQKPVLIRNGGINA